MSSMNPNIVDLSIKIAFLTLDRDIIQRGADAALAGRYLKDSLLAITPAYAGSCALVSIYDSKSKFLKVACTGDSRAVLGRQNSAGEWEVIPLSIDQTGFNKQEAARINADHPNEVDVIKDGRVLGLAVTRAFGDGPWKWPRKVQEAAQRRFYGRRPSQACLSPPYLTAEPVVTTTKIQPEKNDFLIMASDGLWDNLTSKQAVDLVGRWLKIHDPEYATTPRESYSAPRQNIPIRKEQAPKELAYTSLPLTDPTDFTVVDDNAATHLVRNALGGANENMFYGNITSNPPFSRNVR